MIAIGALRAHHLGVSTKLWYISLLDRALEAVMKKRAFLVPVSIAVSVLVPNAQGATSAVPEPTQGTATSISAGKSEQLSVGRIESRARYVVGEEEHTLRMVRTEAGTLLAQHESHSSHASHSSHGSHRSGR